MAELVSERAAPLFDGWEESMLWGCLDGTMGEVVVDDDQSPQSALALVGGRSFFAFLAGKPDAALLRMCEGKDVIIVPRDEAWSALLEENYGKRLRAITRYATRKDTLFDRERVAAWVESLPAGYRLEEIDERLYQTCLAQEWSQDLVANYPSWQDYQARGLGYVVVKDGRLVAGASSYASYAGGIEIEVDTVTAYRRQGLATACAARLIQACLERGLYPSWDAHTLASLALAEKLGYVFSHAYRAYEWR